MNTETLPATEMAEIQLDHSPSRLDTFFYPGVGFCYRNPIRKHMPKRKDAPDRDVSPARRVRSCALQEHAR